MVFRTNKPEQAEGGMTQFVRALHELNIDILCANAPQAKGRVEEAGNALLPAFLADYNRRFAKPARNDKDRIGRSRRTTIWTAASLGASSARSPTC